MPKDEVNLDELGKADPKPKDDPAVALDGAADEQATANGRGSYDGDTSL